MTKVWELVEVYRRCKACGEFKPLEHFLERQHGDGRGVARNWRVCAACRGNTTPSIAARNLAKGAV